MVAVAQERVHGQRVLRRHRIPLSGGGQGVLGRVVHPLHKPLLVHALALWVGRGGHVVHEDRDSLSGLIRAPVEGHTLDAVEHEDAAFRRGQEVGVLQPALHLFLGGARRDRAAFAKRPAARDDRFEAGSGDHAVVHDLELGGGIVLIHHAVHVADAADVEEHDVVPALGQQLRPLGEVLLVHLREDQVLRIQLVDELHDLAVLVGLRTVGHRAGVRIDEPVVPGSPRQQVTAGQGAVSARLGPSLDRPRVGIFGLDPFRRLVQLVGVGGERDAQRVEHLIAVPPAVGQVDGVGAGIGVDVAVR